MECCTGQTECNHIVTIGYLKNFIGDNIKNTGGTVVHVTTSQPDTYCPTYSELTSGSLIPNFVDGGNNRWGSSIDGITINGSYSPNQVVNQEDLILTYVRFKSLSISAGKTTFDECGDSTSMSYVYKLTKTIRAMNNCVASESSSEGNDTSNSGNNKITFSSSQSWLEVNGTSVSASKNGSWSATSRSSVISAKVTYKGTTHSASNTVTITQEELTGSYSVYEGRHYYSVNINSYDGPTFNTCDAVDFSCRATGYYYDRYKWKDSCGQIYNYDYDDRYNTENGGSNSGHFDKVLCPTESQTNSKTLTVYYHGYSDSLTFTQVCSQTCEDCSDYTTYGSGNGTADVNNCGGNVTVYADVSATIHHKAWVEGVCTETGTTPTSYRQSIVVSIPENATQEPKTYEGSGRTEEDGIIYYTITQDAGPCGGCTGEVITTSWTDKSVNVGDCDTSVTVSIDGVVTKTYDNCSPETTPTSTTQVYEFEMNTTSSVKTITKTYEDATITIYQAAGPCSAACMCTALTIASTTASVVAGNTTNVSFTADCTTNHTVTTSDATVATAAINGSNITITGVKAGTATITLSYTAGTDTGCTKTITTTVTSGCECKSLTLGSTTASVEAGKTTNVSFTADCTTNHTVITSDNTVATAAINGSNITITGVKAGTATITLSYTAGTNNCSSAITVGVSSACTCDNFDIDTTSLEWVSSATTAQTVTITESGDCISITNVSTDNNHFTASISGNKITVTPTATTSTSAETGTLTIFYSANGSTCTPSKTVSLTHKASDCDCNNFAIDKTSLEWAASSTAEQTINITESGSCISITSVSSSNNHFTASTSGNKITVSPTAATSSSEESGTLTISYTANGGNCTSKTVSLKHNATTCTTASCTCYVVGPATLKTGSSIASGATEAEVQWSYTAITWSTASTCDVSSSTTTSTSSHTVTGIPTNNTCGSITRTGSFTWTGYKACDSSSACTNYDATVYWSVGQDRGKSSDDPECTGCYCSGFTLGSTPSSWNCDETDEREVSYTGDCHTDVGATSSNSHFTVTVDQTNKKIKIKPTGRYTGNAKESATITVTYKANGSSCDSKTFDVTHNSGTTCYCPDDCTSITAFSITKTSLEASRATSWVEIGSYGYNSACSDKVGVDSDKTWLSVKAENGTIYGKWDANTSFTDTRSATITAKWGTTSCTSRTGSTTQEKAECDCTAANAAIGSYSETIPATGGTGYVSYTADCGTVSASTDFSRVTITSIDTVNKRIYFSMSANDTSNERYDYLNLWIEGLTTYCTYTKINQYGKPSCDCNTFSADTMLDITFPADYYGTTAASVYNYSGGSCLTYDTANTNTTDFTVSASNGKLTIYPNSPNTSYTDSKTGVVTFNVMNGSTKCTGITFNIRQSSIPCNCTNSSISATSASWNSSDSGVSVAKSVLKYPPCCTPTVTLSDNINFAYYIDNTNGEVYVYPHSANTTFSDRTVTVSLSINCGGNICSGSASGSQGKAVCDCTTANFNVDPTSFNVGSGASSSVSNIFNWTADCGTVKVEVTSGSSWLSIDQNYTSSNYRYFIVTANNTASARTGTIDVYLDGAYSATCRSAVTVTQAEGSAPVTCYCSALTLSDTSVSVNAGASTSVTYSANCVSITSIAASSTGITISTGTTGTINITGNTKGTYTITIKSSAAGSTCPDKTITVNVNCGTIAITPKDSSGECTGGEVTFNATYTP